MWGDKRYHTLNYELRKTFGKKVIKLSLDGGFTCPNRDGTVGHRGCIFCGEEGSGEFAASRRLDIREQIKEQKRLLSNKWKTDKYIAYFQNFTNTYSSYEDLREKYFTALFQQGIVGLAIATRPDCLPDKVMDLLEEINRETYLWVELGLQSIHDRSAKFIRRGYPLRIYDEAVRRLRERNIRVVTHLIFGLPCESKKDTLESVKYVASTKTWGVKFHMLYIQKDTDLYKYYLKNPFPILSREEYISLVVDALEYLPKDMVVHRVTGDGKKELLVEPRWTLDKLRVLSGIDRELKLRNSYQGKKIE
ncbi:MAG: TIGR01212 family radical SAM protein [Tissierellia bacterium]|nr:TIGR01212 family radical SAM protein [Tissierellia bacterium]